MGTKVRLRDIKPCYAPDSLADLHGPYSGKIKLRLAVLWAPGDGVVDSLGLTCCADLPRFPARHVFNWLK